jgi:hypothetical protein
MLPGRLLGWTGVTHVMVRSSEITSFSSTGSITITLCGPIRTSRRTSWSPTARSAGVLAARVTCRLVVLLFRLGSVTAAGNGSMRPQNVSDREPGWEQVTVAVTSLVTGASGASCCTPMVRCSVTVQAELPPWSSVATRASTVPGPRLRTVCRSVMGVGVSRSIVAGGSTTWRSTWTRSAVQASSLSSAKRISSPCSFHPWVVLGATSEPWVNVPNTARSRAVAPGRCGGGANHLDHATGGLLPTQVQGRFRSAAPRRLVPVGEGRVVALGATARGNAGPCSSVGSSGRQASVVRRELPFSPTCGVGRGLAWIYSSGAAMWPIVLAGNAARRPSCSPVTCGHGSDGR